MTTGLTHITDYLLAQSWQIAVLVSVVAAVNSMLQNKSAHIRYLLWMIVLAKCLVPPFYAIPLAILPPQERVEPAQIFPPVEAVLLEPEVADKTMAVSSDSPSVSIEMPPLPMGKGGWRSVAIQEWLGAGWMVGALGFLMFNLLRALRANLWLWRYRKALPAELRSNIEKSFSAHGIERFPGIWLVEGFNQPFVWGLLRGSIYLPIDFLNINRPEHQRNVLGHELSHVLRFDAAVNILQVIAQAIFWFHPLVWWANRKIRQEREKCCDEMAVAHLNTSPKDYSTAILETLAARHEQTRPVPSLAVAGPVKNIEERIKTMLRPGKRFYKRPTLVAATVIVLTALLTVPTALVLTARAGTKATAQPLHRAAADGDIEQVKLLLSKGADVNEKDPGGKTALHCASEKGHAEVAKLLISQGAYVNAIGWEMTPLHFAAMSGDKQTVELLLSKGADINAKDRYGSTPLFEAMKSSAAGRKEVVDLLVAKGAKVPAFHLAAYIGDIEKVKKCLQDGMDINSQEHFCSTALHTAANSGKKDIVEFLISKGAQVDAKDALGVTPLYYAVMHNYEGIADLLLTKGADVNAKNKDWGGFTLLNYAICDYGKEAIELLISKGANVNVKNNYGYTPLVYAIWEDDKDDDKDMVELLISKGADVNAEDNDGYTPLYWAAMQDSKGLVELLTAKGATPVSTIHLAASVGDLAKVKSFIEEGTDVNAKDKFGRTPLYRVLRVDTNDLAEFLIAKGADVNAKDNKGQTPLHRVCFCGQKDVAELLIAKGADVNAKDNEGVTPLHLGCLGGQKDMAELLIANGSNVNAKSTGGLLSGMTPLHLACLLGHKDVAGLLIAKGADIDIKDNNSQTPLHAACLRGHKDVVELLIAKGADMNATDSKKQTALSLAKEQGHDEIVGLLRKHGAKE